MSILEAEKIWRPRGESVNQQAKTQTLKREAQHQHAKVGCRDWCGSPAAARPWRRWRRAARRRPSRSTRRRRRRRRVAAW
uniref:Uncharacterized protein n=1 Tax=Arundo donax TaxID=35708 RepID=A0A0A9GGB4_ARUDO